MSIDLMKKVATHDPSATGKSVMVTRGLESVYADEEEELLRANIGPGVDVFFFRYRKGGNSQLIVRSTRDDVLRAVDESGATSV